MFELQLAVSEYRIIIKITNMKFVWRLLREEQGEQKVNWIT